MTSAAVLPLSIGLRKLDMNMEAGMAPAHRNLHPVVLPTLLVRSHLTTHAHRVHAKLLSDFFVHRLASRTFSTCKDIIQ